VRTQRPGDLDRVHSDADTRTTSVGPELLLGWHWMVDDRLNVAVAVGAMYDVNRTLDRVELAGYFRLGFAL
jgi:hypothetical protein